MGHRTPEFSYDELLEALDMLWWNMDSALVEDFVEEHPRIDAFLLRRHGDDI